MTLYLDTSALVKLYVVEAGSDDVYQWIADASSVCTSLVTFPEARSAFGRRLRERALSQLDHEEILQQLDQDWRDLDTVHVDPPLAIAAGVLSTRHGLRGFDAVQLASALYARALAAGDLVAATFDPVLARAMRAEGLTVHGAPLRSA